MPTTASFLRGSGLHQCDDCSVESTYDLGLQTEMFGKSKQENMVLFCCYPALYWADIII